MTSTGPSILCVRWRRVALRLRHCVASVPLLLVLSFAMLPPLACDSQDSSRGEIDIDTDSPDVPEISSDVDRDSDADGGLDADLASDADLDREDLPTGSGNLHELPVVELPPDVAELEPPAECEAHDPFQIRLDFSMCRIEVDSVDESVWTWGRDHYITGYVRSGPSEVREVAFLSEQLGPPRFFPLGPDESGARRFFLRESLYTRDGEATYEYHPILFTSREQAASWVLAVTPDDRAILYESGSLDIWSCPLGCPQPESVSTTYTICPLAENCDRLTSLPEPENYRAVPTFLDANENLYWLGEQGVWKTALDGGGASELVLHTEVRTFATNGTWIAWVDLEGDAYLAHREGDTRYRLATNITAPRVDVVGTSVWTQAEVDVLAIEDNWLMWWDGMRIRGFDLERRVNLNAAWTTELPSRPLGFELGACSSYALFDMAEQDPVAHPFYVLVRSR